MISDKDFFELLFDDTLNESVEENLKKIIDEELEKSEEEMDSELIEYCLDRLDSLESGKVKNSEKTDNSDTTRKDEKKDKRIRRRTKRYIVIAVAAVILVVGAVTVSAGVFKEDLWKDIIEFYDDHIRIKFSNRKDDAKEYKLLGSELARELRKHGFDSVLLPEAILSDEYKITDIEYEETELVLTANIIFKYEDEFICVQVEKYITEPVLPDVDYQNASNSVESLQIDDLTVFYFQQGDDYTITYKNGLCIYNIFVPFNYNDAINFAKTIKSIINSHEQNSNLLTT